MRIWVTWYTSRFKQSGFRPHRAALISGTQPTTTNPFEPPKKARPYFPLNPDCFIVPILISWFILPHILSDSIPTYRKQLGFFSLLISSWWFLHHPTVSKVWSRVKTAAAATLQRPLGLQKNTKKITTT